MNNYIILIFFILFILFNEKKLNFDHIKWVHSNYYTIKFILKNILLSIPFLTLYFKQDDIVNSLKQNKLHKEKRNVNSTIKKFIAANQSWKCNKCKNILDASYEIDHIIPLYKNGNNEINNLQALCRNCHGKKTIMEKININN